MVGSAVSLRKGRGMNKKMIGIGRVLYERLQSGDTLVEVIVAMLILGLIIGGLVPLFVKIITYEKMNTARVTAYNLAVQTVEAIKSTPFDSVGTITTDSVGDEVYGDPPGQFQQFQIATNLTPGIWYYMYTQIRYKPDPSRNPNDPTTVDYKDVMVEVKALPPSAIYSGNASNIDYEPPAFYPDITMNTLITREDQWDEAPGGSVIVTAKVDDPYITGLGTYVANMTVDLTGPTNNPTTYQLLTDTASGDSPGEALFAALPPGTYTMIATDSTNPPDGWMVIPADTPQLTTLAAYPGNPNVTTITTDLSFRAARAWSPKLTFSQSLSNGYITLEDDSIGFLKQSYGPINGTSYNIPQNLYPGSYTITVEDNGRHGGYTCSPSNIDPNNVFISLS